MLIVTSRDVEIAKLRQRTSNRERQKAAAAVVRHPCLADGHDWEPHPVDDAFDRCDLCHFLRVHDLRNKPRKAIKECTRLLDGRNLASKYDRSVEILVAPYLNLRHYFDFVVPLVQPLVRLDIRGLRQWVPSGSGEGHITWPSVMRVARKYVKEPPVVLFKQLRAEIYGEPAIWPSYLGDEPGLDCGISVPDEPVEEMKDVS